MSQSRKGSAFEAFVNIAVGLIISIIANHLIFPLFGFVPSLGQNIAITIIYTAISFVRSYCLRRVFNYFGARV